MKLLIVGHSYVRELRRQGSWHLNLKLKLAQGEEQPCDVIFQEYPGKDYRFFLDNRNLFSKIGEVNPDIIVIILGGNSIVESKTNPEITQEIREFYGLLNGMLNGCLRLAVQIEPRFPIPNNPHGAPESHVFNQRRHVINNFVNKRIKKAGLIDSVILLGGEGYLNNEEFYADGVHLGIEGLVKYKRAIVSGIEFALNARNRQ